MEASAVGAPQLTHAVATRRQLRDLRPVLVALCYFLVYSAMAWGAGALRASPLNHWQLTAGLNLALLLTNGMWYAPAVLAAAIADALWVNPSGLPVPLVIVHALATALATCGAAALIRRTVPGGCVNLKSGANVAAFLVSGFLLAAALSTASAAVSLAGGSFDWAVLLAGFLRNLTPFGIGILAVTPLVVIHAAPWFEATLPGFSAGRVAPARYLQSLRVSRPATLFGLSFLLLAGFAFWLVVGGRVTGQLEVFLLLSVPLAWVAVKRGLEGLSVAVPALVCADAVARWYFSLASVQYTLADVIMLAACVNSYLIGTGVTQLRQTDRRMERKDAILDAVSFAAQHFLGNQGWEAGIQEVMRRLGEATSVTRVFITDKRMPEHGAAADQDTWMYGWTTTGVATDEADTRMLTLLRAQLIEEHSGRLEYGQPCLCRTRDIDPKKREMLEALGVRSAVIVPMFVDHQWWGCVGLEQCFVERDWPASDLDALKMAGQILGTLISSLRVEQQFRQLTGNIHAVFWISAPDGHAKQYVSPGYEEIWGRTSASLQKNPASWLESIHEDDHARVTESLVKQSWGEFDEEYRVLRPDGSLRWVRDRAFPVKDQAGRVYRIVGLAEDITAQKKTEEQLRAASGMLSSLIDHLNSGVVVEDDARHITHVNQAFNSMFRVPLPPTSLFGVDSRLLFHQQPHFAERIEAIMASRTPILGEELEWQDRIFIRNYVPLSLVEGGQYHLWQYQDVTDSRQAEEQIKASLKEKEVLLKEIHHRVKNNLQIICSLLNLQASEAGDNPCASQAFKESQNRIKAMALIHERLYQSKDLAKIDFGGYVRNLTGNLLRSYRVNSSAIRLTHEIDEIPMNFDLAIPCGLIINELVSNSLKYAFPNGKGGDILVRLVDQNSHGLRLTVRDSGVGFQESTNPEEGESLGLKLVRSLTEQLGGTVRFSNQDGFHSEIDIPLGSSAPRRRSAEEGK